MPGFPAAPVGATKRSPAEAPEDELDEEELEDEELDDELEEEEDDDEEEELDDDELELEDEELEEDELEEELEDELEELPPEAGLKAATERTIRLPLDEVHFTAFEPVVAARVEPAPPLLPLLFSYCSVCPEPGVNATLEAPLPTTSTNHEPAVATEIFAEIAVPEETLLVTTASGPCCATPVREIAPAVTPLTAPPKVTWTL